MPISKLTISNFRNLTSVDLAPSTLGLNIICGQNGSGKTSILEAIHYIGHGKSFRTSSSSRMIQHETDKFSLFSHIVRENQAHLPVGVEKTITGSNRLRIAGEDATSIAELARYLPIRVINSQSHQLLESGPSVRRKYLDWGLFYQSESFLSVWRQFERVLKQRNTVLKERRPKRELDVWTNEMARYGIALDSLRREYIEQLQPLLADLAAELLGVSDTEIHYESGWNDELEYETVLANSYHEDMRYACTQYGPHRADVDVNIGGRSAKHFLSRGQQKLLICAMILAQGMLLSRAINKAPIYLVDDLPAELDDGRGHKLVSLLIRQKTQVFITAIDSGVMLRLMDADTALLAKVFHVEHGCIRIGGDGA